MLPIKRIFDQPVEAGAKLALLDADLDQLVHPRGVSRSSRPPVPLRWSSST